MVNLLEWQLAVDSDFRCACKILEIDINTITKEQELQVMGFLLKVEELKCR